MKRTASPSGAMTSVPSISSCRCSPGAFRACRAWRSTATADEQTRAEIVARLELGCARVFISSFDRPNIRYRIAEKDNPRRQLLEFLNAEHDGDAGIVYCLSRASVDDTARVAGRAGSAGTPVSRRA